MQITSTKVKPPVRGAAPPGPPGLCRGLFFAGCADEKFGEWATPIVFADHPLGARLLPLVFADQIRVD
jgi:hypothetical protein